MKPDRLPSWEALAGAMHVINDDAPLELVVLKMHLFCEAHLYRLLTFRLEMDESRLPPLQFFTLAKLALGGKPYSTTLVKVLALNDLRNEFAHELDEQRLTPAFAKFCERTGMFWPPEDVAGRPADFAKLRASAVESGAILCANEIWAHMARLIARQTVAQGNDTSELQNVIAKAEELMRAIVAEQSSVRRVFTA